MLIYDVIEVDDTEMIQATVERGDGTLVVTTFCDRAQLMEFVRDANIYGTDPRLITGTGNRAWV